MKYTHVVKHNGVWYQAGEEVPDDTTPVVKKAETVTPEPVKEIKPTSQPAVKKRGRRPRADKG